MSNTEIIPDVPLDLIGPFSQHPAMVVQLSRHPTKGGTFTGTASHLHGFSWIQTDLELRPIQMKDLDLSRGVQSYTVRLPESDVYLPARPSFPYDDDLGWSRDLGTDIIEAQVIESNRGNGSRPETLPHTLKLQVRRRLILESGIAACLRNERSEEPLGDSVRVCLCIVRDAGS